MAPRKQKVAKGASGSRSFDGGKFISKKADRYFYDTLTKMIITLERGISWLNIRWEYPKIGMKVIEIMHKHQWGHFCTIPVWAVENVVREFYANLFVSPGNEV